MKSAASHTTVLARIAFPIAFAGVLSSAVGQPQTTPTQPPTTPPTTTMPPTQAAASEFWVLADSQLNNLSAVSTRTHSAFVKGVAGSAIRPPTLDLWSEVLLARTLESIASDKTAAKAPVFFLGDAANISCTNEYWRFLQAMKGANWFGVLGNHDGYYMGNYTWAPDGKGANPLEVDTWSGACNTPIADIQPASSTASKQTAKEFSALQAKLERLEKDLMGVENTYSRMQTMPKTLAVWMYLNDLHARKVIAKDPMALTSWERKNADYAEFLVPAGVPNGSGMSIAVYASIALTKASPSNPDADIDSRAWKAFVAQDVTVSPKLHMILIDTSDFAERPPSGFAERAMALVKQCEMLPGICGDVNDAQMRVVDSWIKKIESSGARYFIMGHHDWQGLTKGGKKRLKASFTSPAFAGYVSGHTHKPNAAGSAGGTGLWEINVASTTDWPIEYTRFVWSAGSGSLNNINVETLPVGAHTPANNACPLGSDKANWRAEKNYFDLRNYTVRAASQYATLTKILLEDVHAPHRAEFAASCDVKCLEKFWQKAKLASTSEMESIRRQNLADLMELDRTVLRQSAWVRETEAQCATWAGQFEGGGKTPINGGRRLRPGPTQMKFNRTHAPR